MKNIILTGTGMKSSVMARYYMYGTGVDIQEAGMISHYAGHDNEKFEYNEYLNALARLAIIWQKDTGTFVRDIKGFGGVAVDKQNKVIYAEYCNASNMVFGHSNDMSDCDKVLFKIEMGETFNAYANTVSGLTGTVGRYTPVTNKPRGNEYSATAGLFAYLVWLQFNKPTDYVQQVLKSELNEAIITGVDESAISKFMMDLMTVIKFSDDIKEENKADFSCITSNMKGFIQDGVER